jgi:RNA polymerase sigma-70 factor (ECF subfamily)
MNPQLIREWYDQYRTGIYRFALSLLKSPQQAEDVLQETFVKLLTGKFTHPTPGKEKAWLFKVARNLCMDILRKRVMELELPPEIAAPAGENWEFLELISPLTQEEQMIVSLRFIGGFTHKEIAKITGTTVHAAKKRYERAIQKLREEMEVSP